MAAIESIYRPDDPRLGPWLLVAHLGAGSQGRTWLGRDSDGLEAAVKLLHEPPGDELATLARVVHPAIPDVLGAGGVPRPWLAMERVHGRTLTAWSRRRGLPIEGIANLLARIADALAACHAVGVCHGDVKPSNIMLADTSGEAWLVDFGMSTERGGGSAGYAAPERFHAKGSAAADIYSLGLVAYELLERLPGLNERLTRELEPPAAPVGFHSLSELVGRMVRRAEAERPRADEVVDELHALGFSVPPVDAARLGRRAFRADVRRPVHEVVDRFVERGGLVRLTGPAGSGRRHALRRARHALWADGLNVATVVGGGLPWAPVRELLATSQLDGPARELESGDRVTRAWSAAEAIRARCSGRLHVLVDASSLDEGTVTTLRALAEQDDVAMLWFGDLELPDMVDHELAPWPAAARLALAEELLGGVVPEVLGARLARLEGHECRPGWVVSLLLEARASGALTQLHRGWSADEDALERVGGSAESRVRVSDAARALGSFVAAYGAPVDVDRAQRFAGHGGLEVVQELVQAGLVTLEGAHVRAPASALHQRFLRDGDDPRAVWRQVLEARRDECPPDPEALAWAAVRAGDIQAATELGPDGVRAVLNSDVAQANALADALVAVAEVPSTQLVRLEALAAAGRLDDARALGEQLLAAGGTEPEVVAHLMNAAIQARDIDACAAFAALAPVSTHPALLRSRAQYAGWRRDFEETLRIASILRSAPEGSPGWRDGVLMAMKALAALGRPLDAVHLVEQALAVRPELASDCLVQEQYCKDLRRVRRYRDSTRAAERAAANRSQLSAVDRAAVTGTIGRAWYESGDLQRTLRWWQEAATGYQRVGNTRQHIIVLTNLCQAYREAGRPARALAVGEEALAEARATGFGAAEVVVLGNLGDVALQQGDLAEARARWEAAFRRARDLPGALDAAEHAWRMAKLAVAQQTASAEHLVQEAVDAAESADDDDWRAKALCLVARCAAHDGRAGEVAELEQRVVGLAKRESNGSLLAELRIDFAEAWLELGRHEEALDRATLVRPFAEEFGRLPLVTRAERVIDACRADRGAHLDVGERLARLVELSVTVLHERRPDRVTQSIAHAARELTDADRCLVITRDLHGEPVVAARVGRRADDPPSWSVVQRCLELGREVVANDITERGDLRWSASVQSLHLHAALCVPWSVEQGRIRGAIYVDLQGDEGFHALSACTEVLRALATFAGVALGNAERFEAQKDKVRTAHTIIHDMKNTLCAVRLAASSFAEEPWLIRSRDLRSMERTTEYCEEVMGDYLAQHPHNYVHFELAATVRDCVEQAQWLGSPHRIDVDLETLEGTVNGLPQEASRAVMNLLTNAIKYSKPDTAVKVRMFRDGRYVVVSVHDTGDGIPDGYEDRIFELGVQAPGAQAGHGIGLPSARSIARGLGGKLWCRNHDDGGAVFELRLPVIQDAESE